MVSTYPTLLTGQPSTSSGRRGGGANKVAHGGSGGTRADSPALVASSLRTYVAAADRALDYLGRRVLSDDWVRRHDDVAYYFKAPVAFADAGRETEAEWALNAALGYLEEGGASSDNWTYSEYYPQYPWMYMCWAATLLQKEDLAADCYRRIDAYTHPTAKFGLVSTPYSDGWDFEADMFATAILLKVSLLQGELGDAEMAGQALVRALEANREHMRNGKFYLRWRSDSSEDIDLATDHEKEHDHFYCVLQSEIGQRYFFLGFPAMMLLELAKRGIRSDENRSAAFAMLKFLLDCEGASTSPMAHKVARASAMAASQAPDKEKAAFLKAAISIADNYVRSQQPSGCFHHHPEAMDAVDQTAEISLWLRQIHRELSPSRAGK